MLHLVGAIEPLLPLGVEFCIESPLDNASARVYFCSPPTRMQRDGLGKCLIRQGRVAGGPMDDEQGREEFELFFHAYAHRLVAEAFLLTGNRQDAQDLVQEVFVRVWQHWPIVAEHDHPEAWGRRVMRNLAANRWRRSLLEQRHRQMAVPEHGQAPDADHLDIVKALQQLSGRPRQAMILHAVVGLSVEEIAGELRVPAGTVRSWLHRSRRVVATHLGMDATLATPGAD